MSETEIIEIWKRDSCIQTTPETLLIVLDTLSKQKIGTLCLELRSKGWFICKMY